MSLDEACRVRAQERGAGRCALTELTALALHLGHCHTVVGSGGHVRQFAYEKSAFCEYV